MSNLGSDSMAEYKFSFALLEGSVSIPALLMQRSEFTFVDYFRHRAVDCWDGWVVRRGMAALRGRGGGGSVQYETICDYSHEDANSNGVSLAFL